MPHEAALSPSMHVEPLQQPVGQLVESHTHAPATHAWPVVQAGLAPHAQLPPLQLSAVIALQGAHAAPELPHWVAPGVWHWLP